MTTEAKPDLLNVRLDHTGALRRPEWLRELGYQFSEGKISAQELREGQDKAIAEMIKKEEEHGIPVVSDGEMRRQSYHISFGAAVAGYDQVVPYAYRRPAAQREAPGRLPTAMPPPGPAIVHRLPVKERLHYVANPCLDEYRFAASQTDRPVKVALIGPDRVWHRFAWEDSKHVYPDPESFMADVVAIDKRIIQELHDAGCRYVQFDEPSYIDHVDAGFLQAMKDRGEDSKQTLARAIKASNEIIDSFPDMTFGVHICRGGGGGRGGRIHREGSYDPIAEQLFNELHFKRYLLEYDSEQAGGFEPLASVPPGKTVMLGLVCNNTPDVESADYLRQRLDEASKFISMDQAAIGPRCGLGSLTEEILWGKIDVLRQVADETWGKNS